MVDSYVTASKDETCHVRSYQVMNPTNVAYASQYNNEDQYAVYKKHIGGR